MSVTGTAVVSSNESSFIDVEVYPNPSTGELFLNCKKDHSLTNILIYDTMGRLVYRNNPFKNEVKLNLEALQSNIYLLKVFLSNDEVITKTVVLHH